MKLVDRHIVLTGASSGIGREIATLLAPRNRLTLLGRREPQVSTASARFVAVDLADPAAVIRAAAQVAGAEGAIDGLINCAAVQYTPKLSDPDFDPSSVMHELAVNFAAPVLLSAGLLERLRAAEVPFICNVNSGLALAPKPQSAVYCASKAALDNFSRSLRAQLRGTDIAVLQAFLPVVDTPMTHGRGREKMSAADAARAILRGIELRRPDNDIGKVRLLRLIHRAAPSLAARIIEGAAQ